MESLVEDCMGGEVDGSLTGCLEGVSGRLTVWVKRWMDELRRG